MNICDNGHGEVCYESAYCPACQEKNNRDDKINAIWEKYKHLDKLLTTEDHWNFPHTQWLSDVDFKSYILYDLWQAIRRDMK